MMTNRPSFHAGEYPEKMPELPHPVLFKGYGSNPFTQGVSPRGGSHAK